MRGLARAMALTGAILIFGSQAQAFECPVHLQQADGAIAKAKAAIGHAESTAIMASR